MEPTHGRIVQQLIHRAEENGGVTNERRSLEGVLIRLGHS